MEFRLGRLSAAILLILASALPAAAQSFVYALESGGAPTVHFINAGTGHELSTMTFGTVSDRGTAMRLSSDGSRLFVITLSRANLEGTLWVLDALKRIVLAQIPVSTAPTDLAILPDNSRAYIVSSLGPAVTVVDLSSSTVTTLPGGSPTAYSGGIVVTPSGNAVYITHPQLGSVEKISTTDNSTETAIAVGAGPLGVDISPDGSRLFVANSGNATISVIDANLDSVLRVIPAGSSSAPPLDVSAQSPTRVFVALSDTTGGSSAVQLLNTADGAVVGSSTLRAGGRFARDVSGTPTYVVETAPSTSAALKRVAVDASSTTALATATNWNAAAVLTDPCAFESTLNPPSFGSAGGTATLTIAAPAGCAWTIDASAANGFTINGALTGTGPATRTVSVTGSNTPKLGTLVIGRQVVTLDLTIPRMNIDFPRGDVPVLQQPFTLAGWAIDQNLRSATSSTRAPGIDFLHVWAYPPSGASPIFLGSTVPSVARPDVAALYGSNMTYCGFGFTVRTLPTGTYTLVAFAHSEISNQFVISQAVLLTVARPAPVLFIDVPPASPPSPGPSGSIDLGTRVSSPFEVGGWAIDPAAASGSGVDAVHIWGYPVPGGSPIFVGAAPQTPRPDVAAAFGSQYLNAGFHLFGATLPPGTYDLVVFAHSTVTGTFNNAKVVRITVQ